MQTAVIADAIGAFCIQAAWVTVLAGLADCCSPCVKGNTVSSENQWAGAASDTGNVLNGTALGALLGGSEAAGFSIDYERVPQVIADLEEAASFFRSRAKTALRLADIRPPGTDGSA
jgi:hypothetical protein